MQQAGDASTAVVSVGDVLAVRCGDGGMLGLERVQAAGKRAVGARDFANGVLAKGGQLTWLDRIGTK